MDFTLPNEQEMLKRIDAIKKKEESLEDIVENGKTVERTLEDVKRELIPTVNNRVQRILYDLYKGKEIEIRYLNDERNKEIMRRAYLIEQMEKHRFIPIKPREFWEEKRYVTTRIRQLQSHGNAEIRSTEKGVYITVEMIDRFFCPYIGTIEYEVPKGPQNYRGLRNPTGIFSRYRPVMKEDNDRVLEVFSALPTILLEAYTQHLEQQASRTTGENVQCKKKAETFAEKIDEPA